MTEPKRRLSELIADPSYVEGLPERSTDDLKGMRDEASELENELSFERRLCQARLDILSAELDHRAGRVEGDVISRLPQILADDSPSESSSPLPRRPPDFSMPRTTEIPRRRVEEIVGETTLARLTKMPEEQIRSSIEAVAEHERNLSANRKRVHEVLDLIQAEMVKRYASGEADADLVS
ncbi:MAG: hypothetical protein ACRDKT_17815 [Actinomycetota bacterium]